MIVLALSTSTPRASVALVRDDRVLAELTYEDPRGHAERVFALVDSALSAAGCARSDVGLVASDIGPGSFTGARIAVASAKGIAVGLGVPLAGVVSLEAMAADARARHPSCSLVAAAIDAKKDELYIAVYDLDGGCELLAPSHVPCSDARARIAQVTSGRTFAIIVDAPVFADLVPDASHAVVSPPTAGWVGRIAAARFARAGASDPADVVPLYVRAPDAIPAISAALDAFDMLPTR